MIKIASKSITNDNNKIIKPTLFKFDAEGVEFSVLNELLISTSQDMLPKQMVIEFHLRMWHSPEYFTIRRGGEYLIPLNTSKQTFDLLEKKGYRIIHRADNPGDDACTELTVILEDDLPSLSSL